LEIVNLSTFHKEKEKGKKERKRSPLIVRSFGWRDLNS
jgi:hypothetical protein